MNNKSSLLQKGTHTPTKSMGMISRGGGDIMRTPTRRANYSRGSLTASPSLVSMLSPPGTSQSRIEKNMTPRRHRVEIPFDFNSTSPRKKVGTPLSTRSQDLVNTPTNGNGNRNKGMSSKSPFGKKETQRYSSSNAQSPMKNAMSFEERTRCTPSRSHCDRFIPNRSQMRVDICRASVFSAEKLRMEAIERRTSGQVDQDSGDAQAQPNSNSTTSEILTPIQSEYRARLRGTLLNLSADAHNGRTGTRNFGTSSNTQRTSETVTPPTGLNRVIPSVSSSDEVDLVYADISSENAEGRENVDPCERMLSFRSSVNSMSFSSASSFDGQSRYSTPTRRISPQSSTITPDPYAHDQLRVFDRASGTSMFQNPAFETALRASSSKTTRKINSAPTRILDAPELVDDYYLNLISWGKDNILAVALGQCVYLWNATSGDIRHLLTLPGEDDFVTSVRWADMPGHTNYLAVGTNEGPVQLWDADAIKKLRTMRGHAARVGSLAWSQHILSSGGRDSVIIQHDVRSASHIVSTYAGHTQEVCGLEWNEDGTTLASGGNENYLCVWDATMSARRSNQNRTSAAGSRHSPRLLLTQHQAAVKALAWCPFHRGLLASGGGTADRTIKFWNSNSGALLNSVDTGSQVCSLLWSKHQRELCSSHGFSENQLILWRYPTMTKIQEFKGHTARVSIYSPYFHSAQTILTKLTSFSPRYFTWSKALMEQVSSPLQQTRLCDFGMCLVHPLVRVREILSLWELWEVSQQIAFLFCDKQKNSWSKDLSLFIVQSLILSIRGSFLFSCFVCSSPCRVFVLFCLNLEMHLFK